jgi:hypothetical protein
MGRGLGGMIPPPPNQAHGAPLGAAPALPTGVHTGLGQPLARGPPLPIPHLQAPGVGVGGGVIGGQPPLIPGATQTLHDYSGIAASLARLAPIMTDADTARNLRWQQDVAGDKTKNEVWKVEATSLPGLQFYAYMQPGNPFLVVGVHDLLHEHQRGKPPWQDDTIHGRPQDYTRLYPRHAPR